VLFPLEGWWRFPLWMLIAWSAFRRRSVAWAVEFDGERWWLRQKRRRWEAELLGSSFRSRYVVLLHFRLRHGGRFVAVPVWRDSVDGDDFHRLLVLLNWWLR